MRLIDCPVSYFALYFWTSTGSTPISCGPSPCVDFKYTLEPMRRQSLSDNRPHSDKQRASWHGCGSRQYYENDLATEEYDLDEESPSPPPLIYHQEMHVESAFVKCTDSRNDGSSIAPSSSEQHVYNGCNTVVVRSVPPRDGPIQYDLTTLQQQKDGTLCFNQANQSVPSSSSAQVSCSFPADKSHGVTRDQCTNGMAAGSVLSFDDERDDCALALQHHSLRRCSSREDITSNTTEFNSLSSSQLAHALVHDVNIVALDHATDKMQSDVGSAPTSLDRSTTPNDVHGGRDPAASDTCLQSENGAFDLVHHQGVSRLISSQNSVGKLTKMQVYSEGNDLGASAVTKGTIGHDNKSGHRTNDSCTMKRSPILTKVPSATDGRMRIRCRSSSSSSSDSTEPIPVHVPRLSHHAPTRGEKLRDRNGRHNYSETTSLSPCGEKTIRTFIASCQASSPTRGQSPRGGDQSATTHHDDDTVSPLKAISQPTFDNWYVDSWI